MLKLGTISFPLSDWDIDSDLWFDLTVEDLEHGIQSTAWAELHPHSQVSYSTIAQDLLELRKTPIGLTLAVTKKNERIIVRVGLLAGREAGFKNRQRLLRVIRCLRRDWNGDITDEEVGMITSSLTEDVDADMPTIYANLPSPANPTPLVGCSKDAEMYKGYLDMVNPAGMVTRLHKYQLRSAARMIRMETIPPTYDDPSSTPLMTCDGLPYHVYYEKTLIGAGHPVYDLPRGGILAEAMGIGKTAIALAVIRSTIHQDVQPPPRNLNVLYGGSEEQEQYDLNQTYTTYHDDDVRYYMAEIIMSNPRPREKPNIKIKKMFLLNTTLIIVPAILVTQWCDEIDKHFRPGEIPHAVVKSSADWKVLEDLDLATLGEYQAIIIDYACLRGKLMDRLLLGVRWKRLILDEGSIASSTQEPIKLMRRMSIERRWLVSGTPTQYLKQGDADLTDDDAWMAAWHEEIAGRREEKQLDDEEDIEVAKEPATADDIPDGPRTSWNERDKDDVARLGNMLSGFLGVEPFCKEKPKYKKLVIDPLLAVGGPVTGAVERVRNLMARMFVKHQENDYMNEVPLRTCKVRPVRIGLDSIQCLQYNAMVALGIYYTDVALTYSSALADLVREMRLTTTWVGVNVNVFKDLLKKYEAHEQDCEDRNKIFETKLETAKEQVIKLLQHKTWAEWNAADAKTVPCNVSQNIYTREMASAWSDSSSATKLLSATSLGLLRSLNKPGTSLSELTACRWERRGMFGEIITRSDEATTVGAGTIAGTYDDKTIKSILSTHSDRIRKRKLEDLAALSNVDISTAKRPLPDSWMISVQSRKIAHVVQRVLNSKVEDNDKYVIVGEGGDLYSLCLVLKAAGIEWCYLGEKQKRQATDENLATFNTSSTKVCLLELKTASKGLHLVVANKMIFLSPLWELDQKAQTIKRIHRMGQMRDTEVEILVAEDTIEMKIAQRVRKGMIAQKEHPYIQAFFADPEYAHQDTTKPFMFEASLIPTEYDPAAVGNLSVTPAGWSQHIPERRAQQRTMIFTPMDVTQKGDGKKKEGKRPRVS